MAHVEVSPDAVAGIGSQVGAAASIPTTPAATVSPPAQDPVSVGVAQTFAARVSAIAEYSAAGGVITNVRADMVTASATGYQQQEQVNQASLTNGGSGPAAAAAPSMPVPAIPSLSPPVVAPPSIGAPPASGRAISQLIHSGAGPEGLFAAAQQMRQHASELSATASQLRQSANGLGQEWDSAAGREAASRVNELGSWYDGHAQHATAAATALEHQGENFGRARAAIATPQQFDDLQRRLETAIAANQAPGSFGRYAPVIAQLQAQLGKLNAETVAHYGDYASGAADPSVVGDPLQAPPRPGGDVQAVGFDVPCHHRARTRRTARIPATGSTSPRSFTSPKDSSHHTEPPRSAPGCSTPQATPTQPQTRRRRRSTRWTPPTSSTTRRVGRSCRPTAQPSSRRATTHPVPASQDQ